jgi:glycosyltransferase involved in cell wall biosynthesis
LKEKGCFESGGVVIYRVDPPAKSGSSLTRLRFSLSEWLELRKIITKNSIDIVDAPVCFGEGFFYSVFKQTPLVLQTFAFSDMFLKTGSYSSLSELMTLKVSSQMENISLRRADRIIANSPFTYDYLVNKNKLFKQKIDMVWEARIDLDIFKFVDSDIKERLKIPSNRQLILYVGWLQARKGIHILIQGIPKILKKYPDAFFVLAGRDTFTAPNGGSFLEYIKKIAKEKGFFQNLRVIGEFLSIEDLVRLYSACDVFVFPSLSETFGWPVIEAMACQKSVVTTRTGIASAIEGLTAGLQVIRPGDFQGLADAVVRVLSYSKKFKEEVGLVNRSIVKEKFNFDRMVNQMVDVYENCLRH